MARMACLSFNFKPKTAIYRPIGKFILAKFFPLLARAALMRSPQGPWDLWDLWD
jgi:hypothetical protein